MGPRGSVHCLEQSAFLSENHIIHSVAKTLGRDADVLCSV
jgi:hypothetical protein